MRILWCSVSNKYMYKSILKYGSNDDVFNFINLSYRIVHVKQWKVLTLLEDCEKAITGVVFGPDAHFLVSASLDNRIRIY